CPSGHSLTAPENLAGRSGKCPKCNAPFVVPSESTTAVGGGSAVEISGSRITPAMGSGKNLASPGEIFVFLCPNGHKLNGPPSLKGKAGQCPTAALAFSFPPTKKLPPPKPPPKPVTTKSSWATWGQTPTQRTLTAGRR